MESLPLDVFSAMTNAAIVRAPGRRFPGVVVQGDTLSSLHGLALSIAERIEKREDEDLAFDAMDLADRLGGLLAHYVTVLDAHDHPFPFTR